MRALTILEQQNLEVLTKYAVSFALIEPTETGLKKSIMDATASVRLYLRDAGVHDYAAQKQGTDHKCELAAKIYDSSKIREAKTSLYRPKTKKGDPRIWFTRLAQTTKANDILAMVYFDQKLHVINVTQLDLAALMRSTSQHPLKELIEAIDDTENAVAEELKALLTKIAKGGPVPALLEADTAVGRTLEALLGIEMNSSKQPDFKGIELKAFRGNKGNRKNLFAQVPNWDLSKFKNFAQILDAFGYIRKNKKGEDETKLYCTVSALKSNSQGLSLKVEGNLNQLIEVSDDKKINGFVVWLLDDLHQRLLAKHKETFWVTAESIMKDGKEHFLYTSAEHTRKPIVSQFDVLLEQGAITLDHLIKRDAKGRLKEKGPLFKIHPKSFNLLFPPSQTYYFI